MRHVITLFLVLFSLSLQAHHSKDHMMLLEDAEQVIANTHQGSDGNMFFILWTVAIILLLVGFIRWWKRSS